MMERPSPSFITVSLNFSTSVVHTVKVLVSWGLNVAVKRSL